MQLSHLRHYAVNNTLFTPTTLAKAIVRLGFVQADPIRAPARAQDLTLRHRVTNYCAGDLETRYPKLNIEEDFFINYGFLPREIHALMHPRELTRPKHIWNAVTKKRAEDMLAFVHARGLVHPREAEAHFAHGAATNYWGGSSNITTKLLDGMHYRGMVRIAKRENGIRLYAPSLLHNPMPTAAEANAVLDQLIDVVVQKYAPLPAGSIGGLLSRIEYGAPQWRSNLKAAIARAKLRLNYTTIGGITWHWPTEVTPKKIISFSQQTDDKVRFLAPFDPIVWDRKRFEILWGWSYRFEAYTPAAKRKLGYYALPLLWRDAVIGWANISVVDGAMQTEFGYVSGNAPKGREFKNALAEECAAMQAFLKLA
jgi:uncharacterized protein